MIQVYKKNDLFVIEDTITETIYPNLTREETVELLEKFGRNETEDRCDFAIKEDDISFEYASLDDKDKTIAEQRKQITDLEAKLAEKEKENNELEFIVEEIEQFAWEQLNNDNFDKYKAYDEMYTKIKQLTKNSPYEKQHQDKISFCIEQLEKVLVLIHNAVNIDSPAYDLVGLYDAVSNQINELKGINKTNPPTRR